MLNLSILIVNYNTKDLTYTCIKSVIDSAAKVKYEIIVVDNGSKDNSFSTFEKLQKLTPNLILIRNKENLGYAKANNQGIRKAKGDYILLLNSDTLVKKHTLDRLVDFARKTDDAGVVGTRLINPDGSIQPSCFNFPSLVNALREYWLGMGKPLDKFAPEGKDPVEVDAVVGASFMITQRAKEIVGTLDERYFMYYEDLDYCRRVWISGLKVYYLPTVEMIHYHGKSGESLTKKDDQWRQLIPSSKIYHGLFKYCLINFVIWSGQKFRSI